MLTQAMQDLINQHTLGFVASVNEQGFPNLSPKGTFVVLTDKQLMFSEIRSPNTLKNIRRHPYVEVNFVDPFRRKGVRVKGGTEVIENTDQRYSQLYPQFDQWGELAKSIRHIVIINVVQAKMMTSPIYDIGASEDEMIQTWFEKYRQMYLD